MKIPEGMNEEEVLEIINRVIKRVAPKFVFGFYEVQDIEQEAFLIAIDGLERYDPSRPLENFLSVHVSNRLKSFKRDNYVRQEETCQVCKDEPVACDKCEKKRLKIEAKKNILGPIELSHVDDDKEQNMKLNPVFIENIEIKEIKDLIDIHLPMSLRQDYLKMLDGVYVAKQKKDKVEQEILRIIGEHQDV